jgi:hypothetical protein
MSWLKRLFGGGGSESAAPAPTLEYNGYVITATPIAEGGQYRVCGTVTKESPEGPKEHAFQRADRLASHDEAVEITFQKGRQIIDESRGRLFG